MRNIDTSGSGDFINIHLDRQFKRYSHQIYKRVITRNVYNYLPLSRNILQLHAWLRQSRLSPMELLKKRYHLITGAMLYSLLYQRVERPQKITPVDKAAIIKIVSQQKSALALLLAASSNLAGFTCLLEYNLISPNLFKKESDRVNEAIVFYIKTQYQLYHWQLIGLSSAEKEKMYLLEIAILFWAQHHEGFYSPFAESLHMSTINLKQLVFLEIVSIYLEKNTTLDYHYFLELAIFGARVMSVVEEGMDSIKKTCLNSSSTFFFSSPVTPLSCPEITHHSF